MDRVSVLADVCAGEIQNHREIGEVVARKAPDGPRNFNVDAVPAIGADVEIVGMFLIRRY